MNKGSGITRAYQALRRPTVNPRTNQDLNAGIQSGAVADTKTFRFVAPIEWCAIALIWILFALTFYLIWAKLNG